MSLFWVFCLLAVSAPASYLDTVGFTDLQTRYGTNLASGAGAVVGQVEAPDGTNYLANTNNFPGKTFTILSGPTAFSSHATTVGGYFYGADSVAPGTTNIRAYDANGFIYADCLRSGTLNAPLDPSPARVLNNSWVGGDTNPPTSAAENDMLERLDHVIDTYGVTAVAGIDNGLGPLDYPLLSQAYNVIAAGLSAGDSRSGPAFADAAGRAKPDIVAPLNLTSWGAALVSGAAALLIDRSLSSPGLTNAADPRVVKALLLTAAAKPLGWHKGDATDSDDSKVPLDWRYGAGELRVNRAYDLLNAGQVPNGVAGTNSAWDLGTTVAVTTNWYFFSLDPARHASLKATLVWHRRVEYKKQGPFNLVVTVTTQNLDLALFTASGTSPVSRLATSTSAVDNVEHLWVTNFAAGDYALAVSGAGAEKYGLAFDAVPAPSISIYGDDTNAAEVGPDVASFTIRRDGSAELQTTVNLSASGTASNGVDFTMPSAVTFTAGQAVAGIVLTPILDSVAEGPETAVITIAPGIGYTISPTNQAIALIADRPVDQWRFENFTAAELTNAAISGDGADPDGDSANLFDYEAANSPKVFDRNVAGRIGITQDGGLEYLSLTFDRRPPPSDVTDIVELSSNLLDWSTGAVQIGAPIAGTNGTETVTFRDWIPLKDADRRFIRRRIGRTLIP